MTWSFSPSAKRYRSDSTGRFIAKSVVTEIRDAVVDAAADEARDLAGKVVRGEITAAEFRDGMRVAIRNSHGANYIFGKGGVRSMTPSDWGRMGQSLREQYAYLEDFIRDIQGGIVSEAQAANRAKMYTDGGVKAFEMGQAATWGVAGTIPEYPGENCEGRSNCRCSWIIIETDTDIEATWKLGGEDPCGPCQSNAATYNPWVIPKPYPGSETAPQKVRLFSVNRAGMRVA